MRPLVQDEKRRAIKYGEKYEYPIIFELHKIRIKWEDSKIVQPPIQEPSSKMVDLCSMLIMVISGLIRLCIQANKDEDYDESDYTDEDGTVPEVTDSKNGEKIKTKKDKKAKKEKKKKKDKGNS